MKTTNAISRDRAAEYISRETSGLIFTAHFVKKDGTIRTMNCRTGVKVGVTGAGMRYDPRKFNMLPVYDMRNRGWRMLTLSTLISFNIHGETFIVV